MINTKDQNSHKPVILFDGYCNLCNGAVQWIIKRDTKAYFHFAPISSDFARQHLSTDFLTTVDSIVLVNGAQILIKSEAALAIARQLPFPFWLLGGFRLIPRFVRDAVYDLIARNRYRIWGKRDNCMVPNPELKARFRD